MGLIDLIFTAVALSMDAFAAAVCKGLAMRRLNVGQAVTVGLYFGGAQAAMPVIGYLLGAGFQSKIKAFDHWIAFALLAFIGAKMLYEVIEESKKEKVNSRCPVGGDVDVSFKEMMPLAIATSVDALAVGVSLAFLGVKIIPSASVIGLITFTLSVLGVGAGFFIGVKFRKAAQISGGVMLILIGLKILTEHLIKNY